MVQSFPLEEEVLEETATVGILEEAVPEEVSQALVLRLETLLLLHPHKAAMVVLALREMVFLDTEAAAAVPQRLGQMQQTLWPVREELENLLQLLELQSFMPVVAVVAVSLIQQIDQEGWVAVVLAEVTITPL